MSTTKNLGIVKAVHVGNSSPTNVVMLWYNTNIGVNSMYYYDLVDTTWKPIVSTSSGSANVIRLTGITNAGNNYVSTTVITSYSQNTIYLFKPSATNISGAATLNIGGLGILPFKKSDGTQLIDFSAGDLDSDIIYALVYDSSVPAFESLTGGSSVSLLYTKASPTNVTVGGLPSGTAITGLPLQDIIEKILVAYLSPSFSAFVISGQSTTIEVGTILSGSKLFTWSTLNSGNITTNTIQIKDQTSNVILISGSANDGSETLPIGSVQLNSPGSYTWRITGTNSNAIQFLRDFSVDWRYRRFSGNSTNTTLTETQIEALSGALASNFAGTYSFAGGGYKYFAWPDSFGSPTTITGFKDQATNLAVAMADNTDGYSSLQNGWYYSIISITNPNGVVANYRLYRSKNILGGAINIVVS